ncbi:MAG: DUF2219 domain-containing protein, partial [Desulfobulbaceae bacterium]
MTDHAKTSTNPPRRLTQGKAPFRLLAAVLLLELLVTAPLLADEEGTGTMSLVFENDLFYDLDQHYTNGLGLIWIPDEKERPPDWARHAARLIPWFPKDKEPRHGYAIGQKMYTPTDITEKNPPADARPYAGWLYGTMGLGVQTDARMDQVILTIGMVGPASLAEQSQKILHKMTGSDKPAGWDSQLRNEPGLILTYQHSWRHLTGSLGDLDVDLTPYVGATIGNIFTYANSGVTMRYGRLLAADYGPLRLQPSSPGSGFFKPAHHFKWYLFAGFDGRLVGHNIFLDGNTFRDSRSVDKYLLVADLQIGIVLTWHTTRISYTHVLRTREYKSQE